MKRKNMPLRKAIRRAIAQKTDLTPAQIEAARSTRTKKSRIGQGKIQ